MDYLFMIELNDQTTDLDALKQTISRFTGPLSIPYIEIDELGKGIVGIAKFDEKTTSDDFFDQIRKQVVSINKLPLNKFPPLNGKIYSTLADSDLPPGTPATWARTSIGQAIDGFQWQVPPALELNSDENIYQVINTLKGGIGGKR